MSWYVEYLLKYREHIRNAIVTKVPVVNNGIEIRYFTDYDNFDYQNLLVVEMCVKKIYPSLHEKERLIIDLIMDGKNYMDICRITGLPRTSISFIFRKICDKISTNLGDIFTDDGYLSYLKKKYNLTEDQIEKLSDFMKHSSHRHSIRRKIE